MKRATLIAILAAFTNVAAFAANKQPKPVISCGCSADACGGVDVYNMGKLTKDSSIYYRVKFVIRGLGEGEESTITRYVGIVPDYIMQEAVKGQITAMPNNLLALETDETFHFGGMSSNTVASIVMNGGNSLLIEPGAKAGTTTITQLLCK